MDELGLNCVMWAQLCVGDRLGDYRQSDFLGTDRCKRQQRFYCKICVLILWELYVLLLRVIWYKTLAPALLQPSWLKVDREHSCKISESLSDKTRPKPDLVCLISSSTSFSVARRARVTTGGSALTALFNVANNDNNRIVMLVLIITSSAYNLNNKTNLWFFLTINIYFNLSHSDIHLSKYVYDCLAFLRIHI